MLRQIRPASTAIALLLGTVLAAPAVQADPPGHAPAHGWRAQQQPAYYAGHGADHRYYGYASASGVCNGDDVGTVLGAVAGGVIGSNVAKGDDRAIGALIGAVFGGVIGHQIGRAGDPACNRVGIPVQGYYPSANYYPAPRPVYVVPNRRPAYVVTAPRPVYTARYRQPDYRHDDYRGNQDRHRDDRGHDDGASHRDRR